MDSIDQRIAELLEPDEAGEISAYIHGLRESLRDLATALAIQYAGREVNRDFLEAYKLVERASSFLGESGQRILGSFGTSRKVN